MRKYVFFFHYNKQHQCMTVHYRNKCHIVENIICHAPCFTKYNKTQPRIVMKGLSNSVVIDESTKTAIIN